MLLCCLVAEDEPGPVMFDKHVEKSLKGFVNYFVVLCLKSIQWAVCVNVGVYVFVRAANVCASGLWVIAKAPQWRSSDILLLHSASPCCAFPFTPTESWQTLTSSYTHLISDRAINTSWPFTHRTTVWGTLHTTGASPRRPDHEHINPQSTHTHLLWDMDKDVSAPVRWRDKSMAFGAREIFTHASKHGSLRCTSRPTQEAHYRERDGRREHRADWWTSRGRSLVRPAIYEISTLFWKVVGCQPAGSVLSALQTVRTAAGQPAHSAGLAPSELLKTYLLWSRSYYVLQQPE